MLRRIIGQIFKNCRIGIIGKIKSILGSGLNMTAYSETDTVWGVITLHGCTHYYNYDIVLPV